MMMENRTRTKKITFFSSPLVLLLKKRGNDNLGIYARPASSAKATQVAHVIFSFPFSSFFHTILLLAFSYCIEKRTERRGTNERQSEKKMQAG